LSVPTLHVTGTRHWIIRYLLACGIVGAASVLRLLVDPLIRDQIPYFIYVASVVVATWVCGIGGGLLSALLSGFVGNYLFVPPRYEVVPHGEDWLAMSLFWVVAVGLVWLVGRWKNAERVLQSQAVELQERGRALGTQTDELRAQARRLQALNEEAERVNRVKDEFLATLSHELRTPLNAIIGWAHLLSVGGVPADRWSAAVQTILRNAHAQVRLVDDLLDVSRIISGKLHLRLAPLDMASVVGGAIDLVRNAAEAKDIQIHATMGPRQTLVGDAERLRQIAWNLLSNAVKFTPRHGRVDVTVGVRDSQVEFAVADTGIGIDPQFLPHLFERFTQADSSTTRQHGGLGLGLAVVRHLVELHGGTVTASSPGHGRGATFRVMLPIRAVVDALPSEPAAMRAEHGAATAAEPDRLRGLRVLVVDDEADARELVGTVLERYGAAVQAAESAREAFDVFCRWRPDVLVADVGMPLEDGYSLMRRIRTLPAGEGGITPAVALTAYAHATDRERALAAGFQEHVPKPAPPEQLAGVIARLAHTR
jgi:signal transduction histidine kinase/ActR/RegA family two-component response regulator